MTSSTKGKSKADKTNDKETVGPTVGPTANNPSSRRGVIPWARKQIPSLRNEFQHIADRVWNFAEDELFSGDMKPAVDLSETDTFVVITMDVPGFDPQDIDIQISGNTITIRSQRETRCDDSEEAVFHRTERPFGTFSRTLALPYDVGENETATCKNGVLTVKIPKLKSSTARKIKVNG